MIGNRNLSILTDKSEIYFYVFLLVSGIPYSETDLELYEYMNDQSDDITEVNDNERTKYLQTPIFKSVSQTLIVDSGDTVRLPCIVDRLEGFVMLWKKQGDILTVAHQIQNKVIINYNGSHILVPFTYPLNRFFEEKKYSRIY